jgi:hypothetical protein
MRMRRFSTGDFVVYEMVQQESTMLSLNEESGSGPRNWLNVYMTVMESREKGTLVLLTETGELHVTHNNNPNLRRASWWERLWHPDRFPRLNLARN